MDNMNQDEAQFFLRVLNSSGIANALYATSEMLEKNKKGPLLAPDGYEEYLSWMNQIKATANDNNKCKTPIQATSELTE